MNSSLSPQVRPDKNGKLVTRHVKTDASRGRTGAAMPAPTLGTTKAKKASRKVLINEVADIIANPDPSTINRYTKISSTQSLVHSLEQFRDEKLIKEIGEALRDPERLKYVTPVVLGAFYSDEEQENYLKLVLTVDHMYVTMEEYGQQMPYSMGSDTSNLYSEMGFRDPEFKGEITEDHIEYFQATLIANKLGIRPSQFPIKNVYYKQIELIRENLDTVVPALPVLVSVLGRDYYKETYADIAKVLEQIEASGNDPEDIGNVMKERQTKDFGLVDEVLNNGVKAMSSGVL